MNRFTDLLGEILAKIDLIKENERDGAAIYEIIFYRKGFGGWRMNHSQDCCESVLVKDIVGDLDDLIGSPILMAEESASRREEDCKECEGSCTWTFYKLATVKGYVTISWLGESNGYYSESVDVEYDPKLKFDQPEEPKESYQTDNSKVWMASGMRLMKNAGNN